MKAQTPIKTMLGEWTESECLLMAKWYHLRKLGLLYPIIHTEGYCLFTFDPVTRWDSLIPLSWERLKLDIQAAETVIITKKEIQSARTQQQSRLRDSEAG